MNGVEQTHMKTYISAALVLFACLPALAEDLRRYEYFQRDGIYDPAYPMKLPMPSWQTAC